jgi:hypothetical protein
VILQPLEVLDQAAPFLSRGSFTNREVFGGGHVASPFPVPAQPGSPQLAVSSGLLVGDGVGNPDITNMGALPRFL